MDTTSTPLSEVSTTPSTGINTATTSPSLDPTTSSSFPLTLVGQRSPPEALVLLETPSPPTSLPFCTLCQHPLATDIVRFVPCLHEFHFECAAYLLKSDDRIRNHCPNCTLKIQSVMWDLNGPPTVFKYYDLGSGTPASGPFIRDDETIHSSMSPREKERVLTLRRLRQKDSYVLGTRIIHLDDANMSENNRCIGVTQEIYLKLSQIFKTGEIRTEWSLKRRFGICSGELLPGVADPGAIPFKVARVNKVRADVQRILKVFDTKKEYHFCMLIEPEAMISSDQKGFSVISHREISSRRTAPDVEDIRIELTTTLIEVFPENEVCENPKEEELINGLDVKQQEKTIKAARTEIASVLENLPGFDTENKIEKACTGVFDTLKWGELECEYCEGAHRQGDCMLPLDDEEIKWFEPSTYNL